MAGKFKKSTSYFDVAAEKAEERQQKIVESASESQKPAPQVLVEQLTCDVGNGLVLLECGLLQALAIALGNVDRQL